MSQPSSKPALARTVLLGAAVVLVAGSASADQLVARGTTLAGKVTAITGKGVEFEPSFGKGSIAVPWENVENVTTDGPVQVLYGEDQEVDAPVRGYEGGKILVGDASVDPKELVSAAALADGKPAFADRMRSSLRYWHGGVDAGINVQQATTDNFGALFAIHALRAKDRTRLILGADYRYANERNPDNPPPKKNVTKDSASGLVRGEYDFTKTIYGFASTDLLYDFIQNLSLRAVPKAGAGYVLWQREPKEGVRDFFSVEAGAGYVYEKYIFNGAAPPYTPDDDYFTIAFGAAAAVLLPRGMAFDWRFDYLPAVDDWGDYVIRTAAGLSVPLIAPVSARIGVVDTYDSTPSGGADKNSLNLDTTLSLVW